MRLLVLTHVPFEGPAWIASWAEGNGHSLHAVRLYAGEPLPRLDAFDRLVIMGGPMNIYDDVRHPWLAGERAFIGAAIAAGKSVLGICLGAQLIADALGSRVYAGPSAEIGWFPLFLTPAGRRLLPDHGHELQALHWHGDTFTLPAGAVRLASSAACANQAFLYADRVLGLQCHLESTPGSTAALVRHCGHELVAGGPWIQAGAAILAAQDHHAAGNRALGTLLDALPA